MEDDCYKRGFQFELGFYIPLDTK